MTSYYFDTSALVKLYIPEIGSKWVDAIVNARDTVGQLINTINLSKIGIVEVASAIALRAKLGDISINTQQELYIDFLNHSKHIYSILAIPDPTITLAASLTQNHPLRGYDAVHLATALELNTQLVAYHLTPITFVSADNTLCQASVSEGLQTENPNNY